MNERLYDQFGSSVSKTRELRWNTAAHRLEFFIFDRTSGEKCVINNGLFAHLEDTKSKIPLTRRCDYWWLHSNIYLICRYVHPPIFCHIDLLLMIFHLLGQIKIHDNDENVFSTLQYFGRIRTKNWKSKRTNFWPEKTFLVISNHTAFA